VLSVELLYQEHKYKGIGQRLFPTISCQSSCMTTRIRSVAVTAWVPQGMAGPRTIAALTKQCYN
jgi:hypothetical protein